MFAHLGAATLGIDSDLAEVDDTDSIRVDTSVEIRYCRNRPKLLVDSL